VHVCSVASPCHPDAHTVRTDVLALSFSYRLDRDHDRSVEPCNILCTVSHFVTCVPLHINGRYLVIMITNYYNMSHVLTEGRGLNIWSFRCQKQLSAFVGGSNLKRNSCLSGQVFFFFPRFHTCKFLHPPRQMRRVGLIASNLAMSSSSACTSMGCG
jgi:hypothetical protein